MAKEAFQRTKPHVNVGTIGHVTTASPLTAPSCKCRPARNCQGHFVCGNTKVDGSRRYQTVTIAVSHVGIRNATRPLRALDVPGRDYVKNMITGAAQMDAAILVGQRRRWPNASDARAHLSARQVGGPADRVFLE